MQTLDFSELKLRDGLKQKHLDAITRIEEQVRKLNRVEGEITKHSKRDTTELEMTEGKVKKVGILQVKKSEIKKKIDLAVDNLKQALKQLETEQRRKATGVEAYYRNNDSEDDEFYDRTKTNKAKQLAKTEISSTLTYDALKIELENALIERDRLIQELTKE